MSTPVSLGFEGGFPSDESVSQVFDDLDLNRAIHEYRYFFPTVSMVAIDRGNVSVGMEANRAFGIMETRPSQMGLTLNSDTPYGGMPLDLDGGPLVVDVPPGPLLGAAMDVHQGWIADLGIPGPDAGHGGRYLFAPPGWDGDVPDGMLVARASTHRILVGMRAVPKAGDVRGAIETIMRVKVRPLVPRDGWSDPTWFEFTGKPQDTTPGSIETTLEYWRALDEVIQREPFAPRHAAHYGELAALGIVKGLPFSPDRRMIEILEEAARVANAQMRVQSFADRRPDRVVWPDRQWQWPALRPENGDFDGLGYLDEEAREIWFFQAIAASPAMFRRTPGGGSLYWLGVRDADGLYLDGGESYTLSVPQPVPAKLFWSLTVYDAVTRSQIQTDEELAALRSAIELRDVADATIDLRFGPERPTDGAARWIKTIPGRGWFVYFRIYGPEPAAFDGSWRLPDFERRS